MTVFKARTWKIRTADDSRLFVNETIEDGMPRLFALMPHDTTPYVQEIAIEDDGDLRAMKDVLDEGLIPEGWHGVDGQKIAWHNGIQLDADELDAYYWPVYYIAIPTVHWLRCLTLWDLDGSIWDEIYFKNERLYYALGSEDCIPCDSRPDLAEFSDEDMEDEAIVAIKCTYEDTTQIRMFFTGCDYYAPYTTPEDETEIVNDAIDYARVHGCEIVAKVKMSWGKPTYICKFYMINWIAGCY